MIERANRLEHSIWFEIQEPGLTTDRPETYIDKNGKLCGKRGFCSYPDWKDAWPQLSKLEPPRRHVFETLKSRVKPFMDLDLNNPPEEQTALAVMDRAEKLLTKIFKDDYEVYLRPEDFCWSVSRIPYEFQKDYQQAVMEGRFPAYKDKLSLHLVISTHCPQVVFEAASDKHPSSSAGAFARKLRELGDELLSPMVDLSAYRHKQKMRTIYSSKPEKHYNILTPVDESRFAAHPEDYHITWFDENVKILQVPLEQRSKDPVSAVAQIVDLDSPLIGAEIVEEVKEARKCASVSFAHQAKRVKTDLPEGFMQPDWEEMVVPLESAGFLQPKREWLGPSKPDSITFTSNNRGPGGCPCCREQHENNNWFICKRTDGRYIVKNYSTRCKTMTIGGPVASPMESYGAELLVPTDIEEIVVCSKTFPQATLTNWGLTGPMESYTDETGNQCWMIQQHLRSCPSCSKHHASDRWLIEKVVATCFTVRNSEPSCEVRGIFRRNGQDDVSFGQEYVSQILESPHSESPFVKLFLAKRGEHIISDGVSLFRFDNTVWRRLADNVAALAMQEFFEELFPALLHLIHVEDLKRIKQKSESQLEEKDILNLRKQLRAAISHTRAQSGINNLVKNMKIQAFVDKLEEQFDKDPNLLAFEDGVLDLRNSEFRPGRAEDMITRAVDYSFNKVAPAAIAEVEAFMERLYPVEEERHVAQLFGGYCMFGRHPEKVLLMLTDDGGERSGHNGKSSFAKALVAALGPHAVKGKNPFLYKAEFNAETANSHNAGDLFYLGKRVAYWEELDPSRRLNDGKLKDLNGGCAMYNFRGCNMKEEFQAEWGCKMIMCFNRSNMPQLDFTDGALVDRLLVLQHRSRFIKSVEAYEEFQHVPNTFPAIDLDDKLVEWRPAIARWLLAGHERWRQVGFTQLPQQCREFTQALVGEQDTVKMFVDQEVVLTDNPGDFFTQKDAYDKFSYSNPEERNKKTALGRNRFYSQLRTYLSQYYKAQHHVAGQRNPAKNVFLRHKLTDQQV